MPDKTSKSGINFIKTTEKLMLTKYKDTGGVWTIGYGHVIKSDEEFDPPITEAVAEMLLVEDLRDAEECVNESVNVSLAQYEFDALVSFVFNVGCGAFRKSTLLKLLNSGMKSEVPKQLMRWVHDNGKKIRGLEIRRQNEGKIFSEGCYEREV